jgi:ADP-heptose:LPS heptosyltransferase
MRMVEVIKNFSRNNLNFKQGHKYVMAEDSETQMRNLNSDCFGMSYPIESIYRPYRGEDLTNKKIMAFRTGGIGDMQFLSPVFRHLKKKFPGCFIRVASGCKQPLENLPEIDELYDMPFDVELLQTVDYHLFFQGIIEASNEQSRNRHAVDLFFSYFSIDSLHFPPEDKRPRLEFTQEEMKWLSETTKRLGLKDSDYVIGIQVESSSPLRNYPQDRLKYVIDMLARETNVKIVLIGNEQQAVIATFYKGNNENVIPAVNFSVRQSIVLANRYNLILAPDSFMIQVAGSLEKPLVGLYGPFPSEVRMAYFKNAVGLEPRVVCSPCFKHDFRACIKGFPSPCFSQLKPEDVLQAIDYQRNKFYGGHFSYMAHLLKTPDFSEIEKYFLSADKGLCFFGGYYKHPNMTTIDSNSFVNADIKDLNTQFQRENYPFVVFMNDFQPKNKGIYDGSKGLVRPGGYFIVYHPNAPEAFFSDLKKDVGRDFTLLYTKHNPTENSFIIVGKKNF